MSEMTSNAAPQEAQAVSSMTMIQALRSGLDVMMAKDDNVIVYGEDVGYFGGVFRVTEGLQAKYGKSRCFDAPISEGGIVGTAVGLCMRGYRPVLEIQFDGFVYPAFDQIVSQLYLGSDGILGTPTLVSATYIFLFILFGTFLEHAGMIRLFNALALGLVGQAQGGPAKVAVISSGLMGTISGSGVANVLTVGQFTIPLMKRFGYTPVFAGAVEATSSMGGQIMPPVMGAVAFIMAETLSVPYAEVVKAAVIPAMLYYLTAFWMVHLEAGRLKLLGLPKDQCPNPWHALKENWYLALPLAVLTLTKDICFAYGLITAFLIGLDLWLAADEPCRKAFPKALLRAGALAVIVLAAFSSWGRYTAAVTPTADTAATSTSPCPSPQLSEAYTSSGTARPTVTQQPPPWVRLHSVSMASWTV